MILFIRRDNKSRKTHKIFFIAYSVEKVFFIVMVIYVFIMKKKDIFSSDDVKNPSNRETELLKCLAASFV